jgi:hypothetical protein
VRVSFWGAVEFTVTLAGLAQLLEEKAIAKNSASSIRTILMIPKYLLLFRFFEPFSF